MVREPDEQVLVIQMDETLPNLWVVELTSPQLTAPLRVRIEKEIVIGRDVPGDSRKPDVDLAPYGAEELGVSRLHAAIHAENDKLMVIDLNSNNGTFLNGNRLKADEKYFIKHSDQLMVGRMKLDMKVILSPEYGGGIHKQPSLQLYDQVQPGKGQLVLIIHKDPEVAAVLAKLMEKAGYTTRVNHEVVGAIRSYNQRRPNAVIIDPVLPDMSGLEFCRYIRRDVMQNTMPVVVINTTEMNVNISEIMQIGADIYLERPISARELRHVISSLITQHEKGNSAMYTKHLVGTAPLRAVPPETRRNAAVMFVAGYSDSPIVLTMQGAMTFGRMASTAGLKSHVDLSRYEAANSGVSRVHVTLHYKNDTFYVEDMNSVNGTYVNGDPVKPSTHTELHNGDEIRLGQLRMYIYFLTDTEKVEMEEEETKK